MDTDRSPHWFLSHYQARPLLAARDAAQDQARTSLDLGRSQATVSLTVAGVLLPGDCILTWAQVEAVAADENSCFLCLPSGDARVELEKIQRFSERFNRVYTLYPTPGPPTMLISGIPMHRIKGADPGQDTRSKLRAVGRITGPVLDTSTGLGYTAIAAARSGHPVVTVELDPTVLDICRLNPWSEELFSLPNVEQRIGDSGEVVETLADDFFAVVIHDPPMFNLAGHLYGTAFYRGLWRVLRPGGRLYHYIGNPESRSGRNVTQGVLRRLAEAGFVQVKRRPDAFGVTARK
ncbi:MAG: methyltransferase domain-containing protein [Caldilineae bacterium]|nr:MAG: methyltransferase domain-containing protein [Caldilineae bacterium]